MPRIVKLSSKSCVLGSPTKSPDVVKETPTECEKPWEHFKKSCYKVENTFTSNNKNSSQIHNFSWDTMLPGITPRQIVLLKKLIWLRSLTMTRKSLS